MFVISGKTKSTKLLVQHISHLCHHHNNNLQECIIQVNVWPISHSTTGISHHFLPWKLQACSSNPNEQMVQVNSGTVPNSAACSGAHAVASSGSLFWYWKKHVWTIYCQNATKPPPIMPLQNITTCDIQLSWPCSGRVLCRSAGDE